MSGMHISVSRHAVARYVERVAPLATPDEAEAAIRACSRSICTAAAFHCRTVKLGCGGRLILDGRHVVTVLSRAHGPVKSDYAQ